MRGKRLVEAWVAAVMLFGIGYAEKRAILIQVGEYRDPMINSFVGSSNAKILDSETMRGLLSRYGFTHIIELTDKEATLEKIREQLDVVRRQTQPADIVVFYFSGHGAIGKRGVTLAPYDAIAVDSSNDLAGDELAQWVRALPTEHVVIILDSCFYFRQPIDPKTGAPRHVAVYPKVIVTRRERANSWGALAQLEKGVVLTAADLGQSAYQMYTGRYDRHRNTYEWVGIFTHALSSVIQHAAQQERALSYQELADQVVRETRRLITVINSSHEQTPQILGGQRLRTALIFESDSRDRTPSVSTPNPISNLPTSDRRARIFIDASVPNEQARQIEQQLRSILVDGEFTSSRFGATHVVERRGDQLVLTDVYGNSHVVLAEVANDAHQALAEASERLNRAVTNHAMLRVLIDAYHRYFAHQGRGLEIKTERERYRVGETLTVRVKPSRSGYLILLSRTADDELSLLFPDEPTEDQFLHANTEYIFPPSPNADYSYQVVPPVGKDFICAIVVETAEDRMRLMQSLGLRPSPTAARGEKGVIRGRTAQSFDTLLNSLVKANKCEIGYVEFSVEN